MTSAKMKFYAFVFVLALVAVSINGQCDDRQSTEECGGCERRIANCSGRCFGKLGEEYSSFICPSTSSIRVVDLSFNSLVYLDCLTAKSIKKLNASHNDLTCMNFKDNCAKDPLNIDLSYNDITTCNKSMLYFRKAEHMNLSHNGIMTLEDIDPLINSRRMESLDLSNNMISYITSDILIEKRSLQYLDLSFNHIHSASLKIKVCDQRLWSDTLRISFDNNHISNINISLVSANSSDCTCLSTNDCDNLEMCDSINTTLANMFVGQYDPDLYCCLRGNNSGNDSNQDRCSLTDGFLYRFNVKVIREGIFVTTDKTTTDSELFNDVSLRTKAKTDVYPTAHQQYSDRTPTTTSETSIDIKSNEFTSSTLLLMSISCIIVLTTCLFAICVVRYLSKIATHTISKDVTKKSSNAPERPPKLPRRRNAQKRSLRFQVYRRREKKLVFRQSPPTLPPPMLPPPKPLGGTLRPLPNIPEASEEIPLVEQIHTDPSAGNEERFARVGYKECKRAYGPKRTDSFYNEFSKSSLKRAAKQRKSKELRPLVGKESVNPFDNDLTHTNPTYCKELESAKISSDAGKQRQDVENDLTQSNPTYCKELELAKIPNESGKPRQDVEMKSRTLNSCLTRPSSYSFCNPTDEKIRLHPLLKGDRETASCIFLNEIEECHIIYKLENDLSSNESSSDPSICKRNWSKTNLKEDESNASFTKDRATSANGINHHGPSVINKFGTIIGDGAEILNEKNEVLVHVEVH